MSNNIRSKEALCASDIEEAQAFQEGSSQLWKDLDLYEVVPGPRVGPVAAAGYPSESLCRQSSQSMIYAFI